MNIDHSEGIKKILLIDDEAGLRRNLQFSLMQNGFEVDDVETGIEGLKLLERQNAIGENYNYVVTDINLPDINGLKLLEIIKSKYKNMPVVIISGYGTDVTDNEVKNKKGSGYLSKPFMVDDLTKLLGEIIPGNEGVLVDKKDEERNVSSAYAFLRLSEEADFQKIFRKLYFEDYVLYCDAVRDEYDIVLLLSANSKEDLDHFVDARLEKMQGVESVDFMSIQKPELDRDIESMIQSYQCVHGPNLDEDKDNSKDQSVSAYVFLEIEKDKFNEIYPQLYFMDDVISCDVTMNKYDIVLLIKGHNFVSLDELIQEKIWEIDGIIRARKVNIIEMFEM